MTKKYQHKEKGFVAKVATHKGKPIVNKNGLIGIHIKGGYLYKGCSAIRPEVLEEDFMELQYG